ncbi:Z1 domain-containing protein [Arthrobacter sp. I2-34]|uniref:Z1 domain-containing protein n=1 Tax=Arthrobacter hankyongi TaxID=2904801 RepID=A0ABS9L2I5_9MICC|nr:Z1 domain-containing protein [Arthrobacter hankyongi]MCG2620859.1 Z1 domain-containing protein [Arthrobacter hankyongi]
MAPETVQILQQALASLKNNPPRALLKRTNSLLNDDDLPLLDESALVSALLVSNPNDPVRIAFHELLAHWDHIDELTLRDGTAAATAQTDERRRDVLAALGLQEHEDVIAQLFPVYHVKPTLIEAGEWQPWDTTARGRFYWNSYESTLRRKGFAPEAVESIDSATRLIVERLADPTRKEPYQSKGLVVGHVQSGKTANFTGLIAKAVDAGYKLIIVLTGTIEMLRSQTQKRIDMELVGQENLLGGVAKKVRALELQALSDVNADTAKENIRRLTESIDYISTADEDWLANRFVSFGGYPEDRGAPRIVRLTGYNDDYKALRKGLEALDFRTDGLPKPSEPLWQAENLAQAGVRLAIVKKNTSSLEKLRNDLQLIKADLNEIPALIIDDEADQASINTTNPRKKPTKEKQERTKINEHIAGILKAMPRCQYVAYTATPFANVFVDPNDSQDIFPKDFIIALEPSPDYMGARAYHDLDPIPDEPDRRTSNKLAYYRPVDMSDGEVPDASLTEALDAFVLAGALKLYRRQTLGDESLFRHHTMLIHESHLTGAHLLTLESVKSAWKGNAYRSPAAMSRLRNLWNSDFSLTSKARQEPGFPSPASFEELSSCIADAVQLIEAGRSPVVLVNGSKESEYQQADINFGRRAVWKILVGGAKLSRGFTVEGLTVSLYTRVATAADTLMQMGRWFGYRRGYRDLVRLYIGTSISKGRRDVDLYDAFESIARDEEDFRQELRQYSELNEDGEPAVKPIDVPPLVAQRLPWLKPTATNKMYNSCITEKGVGGKLQDYALHPVRSDGSVNAHHFKTVVPVLRKLSAEHGAFKTDGTGVFRARYGIVPAKDVLAMITAFKFADDDTYAPEKSFVRSLIETDKLVDFVVLAPFLKDTATNALRSIVGFDGESSFRVQIVKRKRRDEDGVWARPGFTGSSPRQRSVVEQIAGIPNPTTFDSMANTLHQQGNGRRGALFFTFAADTAEGLLAPDMDDPVHPRDLATIFSMALPYRAAPDGIIRHTVLRTDQPWTPFVDKA